MVAELVRPIAGPDAEHVAGVLFATFGSLRKVLAADPEAFTGSDLERRSLEHLRTVENVLLQSLREPLVDMPVLSSGERVVEYLRCAMGHLRSEQVRVLFLDGDLSLIRDEIIATGSRAVARFDPAPMIRRALLLEASGLILAHNHPSGRLAPSEADLEGTRRLAATCRTIDLELVDHLIVTGAGALSFRSEGFLP